MTQKEKQAEKEEISTFILPNNFVSHEDAALSRTGSNKSTITATTCSSTTGTDTQQSSLIFEFGKAAESCIKRLIISTQLLLE